MDASTESYGIGVAVPFATDRAFRCGRMCMFHHFPTLLRVRDHTDLTQLRTAQVS
ncbi:hypothetical protein FKP32DRAFT_1589264 [Trametes sanguinea]|nr:hypothetical protein FKP32DRAFT_1589264 [Trametes sanguinea]